MAKTYSSRQTRRRARSDGKSGKSLIANPEAGDVIEGTGGFESCVLAILVEPKVSVAARGSFITTGLVARIWLFTLYNKDEMSDLTPKQRAVLKEKVKGGLKIRRKS